MELSFCAQYAVSSYGPHNNLCCCLQAVKTDLSNFEDSGSAWPYLLDDFVDWMRDGRLMDTS
jgi:hypothetical protein